MADPNPQLSQLDPKLKEAYDRVMATPSSNSTPGTPTTPSPNPSVNPPQVSNPTTKSPQNPVQPISSRPVNIGPTLQPIGARREPEKIQIGGTPGTQTHGYVAPKKKGGLPTPILVIGGIIFLIVYTIFWLKFFQVPVPYLPF